MPGLPGSPDLLLRDVQLDARIVDVRLRSGRVAAIGPHLPVHDGEVLDADGAVLLPGLRDEHVHLTQWAIAQRRIDLSTATSAGAVARLLASAPAGDDLLLGHGFRDALWAEPPHRRVLDAAFPHRPVVAVSQDLHCAWVNSPAAARFGVLAGSGVVREHEAMHLLTAAGAVDPATSDRWALAATDAAAARGVTAVTDFEFAPITDWARRSAIRPPAVRVAAGVWPEFLDGTLTAGLRTGDPVPDLTDERSRELLRVGPVKLFADGSLGTRTAYCTHAYPDGGHGVQRLDVADLAAVLRRTARGGLEVAVHAIGDAAVHVALDGFAAAGTGGRIEHAQQLLDADVPRFAELGVIASIQPRHCPDDRDAAEKHWAGATDRAFRFADLHAAGADLRFGSDAPVAALDPWDAIAAAVHHSTDERPAWHPEQHLPLDDALAAASGGRRRVAVGDPADLVLLAEHPRVTLTRGGPAALRTTEVLTTITAGVVTHGAVRA